jgi:hypothetical protein
VQLARPVRGERSRVLTEDGNVCSSPAAQFPVRFAGPGPEPPQQLRSVCQLSVCQAALPTDLPLFSHPSSACRHCHVGAVTFAQGQNERDDVAPVAQHIAQAVAPPVAWSEDEDAQRSALVALDAVGMARFLPRSAALCALGMQVTIEVTSGAPAVAPAAC